MRRALLTRQSRLFTWSDRMAPCTSSPWGSTTSNGYPLICEVTGQKRARPTFRLYESGETTSGYACQPVHDPLGG
jgi:hypothetical protein